jgi:hypothetical protein
MFGADRCSLRNRTLFTNMDTVTRRLRITVARTLIQSPEISRHMAAQAIHLSGKKMRMTKNHYHLRRRTQLTHTLVYTLLHMSIRTANLNP